MKVKFVSFLAVISFGALAVAESGETLVDGVLTLDGVVKEVASESALGDGVASVVMQNGGGVAFTQSVTAGKTYSIAGDGLASTGIVSVAAGKTFSVTGAQLAKGSVGHVLVKRGAGTLASGSVAAAAAAKTRFVVEEGTFQCTAGDFWGGHSTANTNCTIDVREGATYDHGNLHGVVGPVELTGARFLSRNGAPHNNQWADASLDGGVTAHASATDSYMHFESWGFLGHCNRTNCVFDVEAGARLIVDGVLSNGFSNTLPNRLIKRGAGELVLLSHGGWTGGTVLEGGTVTVADPMALWTGAVTVAGDVTLNVPAGTTFVCPPVTGAGTLTKTGAGVASFPTVAEGVTVTVAEAGGQAEQVKDGVLYLDGGEVVVDVPAGETLAVTLAEAVPGAGKYTDIVKTGAGTLVLPTGSADRYAKLTVKGGFVDVANESCFGSEGVTVQDGAGLRFLASFNQARSRITCRGAATLDVPQGVTLGIHSNYFVSTGCAVTKTGAGTWELKTVFRKDLNAAVDFTGTTWITHEGTLKFMSGDNFHGHTGNTPLVLEAHEGAVLEIRGPTDHLPLRTVVLRGATMHAFVAQFRSDTDVLEGGAKWKGFGLNGPIVALPSRDGRPSRIVARICHLAHGTGVTTFDVRDDAVLELETALAPGLNSATTALNESGLVKAGGGTLRLLRPVGTRGVFDIQAGVVELGPKMKLNDGLRLKVAPAARLRLGDGAQVAAPADLGSALCASADVWFDASALSLADGASVESVPNLGTAGGTFTYGTWNGYKPAAPKFVRDGIGGRGTLHFNGSQALLTQAHTNRGAQAQVYIVSKWTSWAGGTTGGKGRWGAPFSMSSVNPYKTTSTTCDDNHLWGALSFQHGSETTVQTVSSPSGDGTASLSNTGIAVGEPYITHAGHVQGKCKFLEIWRPAGYAANTNNNVNVGRCDVDAVCVGGRTRKGVPQIWGAGNTNNRVYIGQIGEVLVFARALSATEEAAVYAYLKRKWFASGEPDKAGERLLATPLAVDVPAGEASLLAAPGETGGAAPAVRKTGAGALRLGGAFAGAAFVDVAEGGLALRKGALPSQVDVWLDATDAAGLSLDADGRVTNVVNRGSCGGAFVRNARAAQVPAGPVWSETETINGRPTLVFDGDSSLALFSYTNSTVSRRVSVYCVAERTGWQLNSASSNGGGLGKWGAPWSLGDTTAKASDEQVAGVIVPQEGSATQNGIDLGETANTANLASPQNGEPYLMVFHCTTNASMFAYEKTATSATAVPRAAQNDLRLEPLRVNVLQLATRTRAGGGAQWWGKGDERNRCWYGKLGEIVVTTEPLSMDQETELFAYLRKKWMDKGSGSATPPAWLSGVPADPVLGAQTELAMADGTKLVHAADTAALGALVTEGSVDWTRIWTQTADESSFTLFDVAGDVSLGAVALDLWPVPTMAKLVGVGGSAADGAAWTVAGDTGARSASVTRRADGYWISRVGTVIFIR